MHLLACHQWCYHVIMSSKLETKLTTLGYSRKNPNIEVKDIIFWPPPPPPPHLEITLRNPRENKLSPMQILQNNVTLLGNFKVQNQDLVMEIIQFYLLNPKNSTFHLTPGKFFLQYPWKFHVLNPRPCLDFFWSSPFWAKNLFLYWKLWVLIEERRGHIQKLSKNAKSLSKSWL